VKVMLVATEQDGTLRAFHEAAMDPADLSVIRKIARKQISRANGSSIPEQMPLDLATFDRVPPWAAVDTREMVAAQSEMARARGYLSDPCPSCWGFFLKRTGTCTTCDACGHNPGCG
jgi:hypothetical protein